MKNRIIKFIITVVLIFLLCQFTNWAKIDHPAKAVLVAVALTLLNTFIKPIIVFFTLPITFFTLGLFLIVLNGIMVLLCDLIVDGFEVTQFINAIYFSLTLSLLQGVLRFFVKEN